MRSNLQETDSTDLCINDSVVHCFQGNAKIFPASIKWGDDLEARVASAGRKTLVGCIWHVVIDVQELTLSLIITPASMQDRDESHEVLVRVRAIGQSGPPQSHNGPDRHNSPDGQLLVRDALDTLLLASVFK